MLIYSKKLTDSFAFEISLFHKLRNFSDGISFFEFTSNLDLYKGEHNPKFRLMLVVMNFKIFEIEIYNVNHVEND
jgi:hypothetical protein